MANPFLSPGAAPRYARYRPDFSDELATILADTIGRVALALDVAAGTGISTAAVAVVAERVIAIDASAPMLSEARPRTGAPSVVGTAERLPFAGGRFDLITVGSALHWFDRDRFAGEAARVASPKAWLVLHEHVFTGQMEGAADFHDWIHHHYLRGYPSPLRGEKLAPGSDLGPFRHSSTVRYEQLVSVTRDQLAGYLMTQSNLQAVMTTPQASDEVTHWLEKELDPFFVDHTARVVRFAGMAGILRR